MREKGFKKSGAKSKIKLNIEKTQRKLKNRKKTAEFTTPKISTGNPPRKKLTPTTSRHHLYMGKKVVHDIAPHFRIHPQHITANNLTPTTYRHQRYMRKKVVHNIAP
ncbi:hypothetical protein KSF78_0009738 [Schistosoma japonicum]|nr:hypothetical protein KSF78_0009738 [Schistosoma japonicum]